MPTLDIDRHNTQFAWPNINEDQKSLIAQLTEELEKNGGRGIRLDQYEMYTTETKRDVVRRPTASPRPPKRNTEQPGWYKQMAAEMGTPRSVTPILKRKNLSESSSINQQYQTASQLNGSYYNKTLNRPESSLSRAYSYESESMSPTPRDRSVSPKRSEKNVSIGGVIEIESEAQEFYPYRDAHHGKPLPGDNSFMHCSWPYGLDHLGNRRRRTGNSPPPRSQSPSRWGSTTSSLNREYRRSRSPSPIRRAQSVPPVETVKKIPKEHRTISVPSSPIPDYLSRLRHIKVATVPVPVPPKFGTLTQGGRWPNEAQGPVDVGPPCELCRKPITEKRFITHENFQYHCWHFTCSYCFKTLRENDFKMAVDNKPYCNNCFKREYP